MATGKMVYLTSSLFNRWANRKAEFSPYVRMMLERDLKIMEGKENEIKKKLGVGQSLSKEQYQNIVRKVVAEHKYKDVFPIFDDLLKDKHKDIDVNKERILSEEEQKQEQKRVALRESLIAVENKMRFVEDIIANQRKRVADILPSEKTRKANPNFMKDLSKEERRQGRLHADFIHEIQKSISPVLNQERKYYLEQIEDLKEDG